MIPLLNPLTTPEVHRTILSMAKRDGQEAFLVLQGERAEFRQLVLYTFSFQINRNLNNYLKNECPHVRDI